MVRAVPTRSTIGRYGHPKGPRIFTVRAAHGKTCGPRTAPTPCPVPTPNRFAHTGLVPFFPYRPHTVLPPCCHYKSLPTRTAPVPPPYRFARTGPVPFCPRVVLTSPYCCSCRVCFCFAWMSSHPSNLFQKSKSGMALTEVLCVFYANLNPVRIYFLFIF